MTTRSPRLPMQRLPGGRGTAVPLVKATRRGILPHGFEAPWVPIPLRSAGLDDSPCCQMTDVGFVKDKSPLSTGGRHRVTPASPTPDGPTARTDQYAHLVYECSSCGERFVGVRRCPDCNLFMHALGVGGVCIHCDEPLLVAELLDEGGATLLG